jgi:exopolysaccharide biosynthesis polyprenyl glycosylphosphotransferase
LSDVVAILFSMLVVVGLLTVAGRDVDTYRLSVTVGVMLPVWFAIAYVAGLYSFADLKINHGLVDEIGKVAIAVTAWSWLLLVVRTVLAVGPTKMAGPILLWMAVIPVMLLSRAAVREIARRRRWNRQAIAVVGGRLEVRRLREQIQRHPEWGLDLNSDVGFRIDSMTDTSELAEAVHGSGAERVMLVGGGEDLSVRTSLVHELIERDLMVDIVSGGPETLYSNATLQTLEGMPVLSVRSTRMRPLDLGMKRAFDLVVSGIGLIMVAPVLAWAAIGIKLGSPGPVFFRQVRCGHFGKEFEMLKLRTMIDGADSMRAQLREANADEGNDDVLFKLEDDPRVTDFGQVLRKWSIDELPQLWNVFIGEMSMVGPRPLPFDEALQATGLFRARTRAKPGIAGPWQAYGRSTIPFSEMIKLDYSYVVGWSMTEDIRLLLRTLIAVARGRGVY